MNEQDALRYIGYQAARCRDQETHEALCLLVPGLLEIFELRPMDEGEAMLFKAAVRHCLEKGVRLRSAA